MKKILNVPKIKQLPKYCGPACLSMVLKYYGINLSQEKLAKEMNFVIDQGVLPNDIISTAKKHGFKVRKKPVKSLDDIVSLIDRGIPPLFVIPEAKHVVIVKGYDKFNKEIYINNPVSPFIEHLPTFLFNLPNNYLIIIKK